MKKMWNKLRRGEKGQALIIVLILMLLGGLIIAPLMSYMGTGLKVGKEVFEKRMMELYAADAGVEDGLWYLQDIERLKSLIQQVDPGYVPPGGDWSVWTPADYTNWSLPSYNLGDDINGKDVEVTVGYLPDDKTFKITSVATSDDSSTTIDAYVSGLDFSSLLDNAITSQGTVTLQSEGSNKAEVHDGDVVYCEGEPPSDTQVINGEIRQDCEVDWPPVDVLSGIYLSQVKDAPHYVVDKTIGFNNDTEIDAMYVDGDLTIYSKTKGAMLMLRGTVYVTGKLTIGMTNKDFTLNLNNQTIFVEDDATNPQGAVDIGGQTHIIGSGCLIAAGGINFQPNMDQSTPTDFMFVMSINDETLAHPTGNFNGSFAGNVDVELKPGDTITWNDPSDNVLNFPSGGYMGGKLLTEISTWDIKLQ